MIGDLVDIVTPNFLNIITFSSLLITKRNEYSLHFERSDGLSLFLVWRKYHR